MYTHEVMDKTERLELIVSLIKSIPLIIAMILVAPFAISGGYLKDWLELRRTGSLSYKQQKEADFTVTCPLCGHLKCNLLYAGRADCPVCGHEWLRDDIYED